MTLEERLTRLAAKGELVHLSLAYYGDQYHAKLALSSTTGGYASAEHQEPVRALELVFEASPVKVRASRAGIDKPRDERPPLIDGPDAITATVNEKEPSPLPNDWTAP